jgi:hypothetical protein
MVRNHNQNSQPINAYLLREEHKFRVFKNKVIWRISETKKDVTHAHEEITDESLLVSLRYDGACVWLGRRRPGTHKILLEKLLENVN